MAVSIILTLSVLGLVVAFYYSSSVNKIPIDMGVEDKETRQRLSKIHSAIDHHTDYVNEGVYTAVAFIFGAIISIASGFIGMKIATQGNVRTTVSANQSISSAFNVAVHSGSVMGFGLVSLASLGLLLVYLGLKSVMPEQLPTHVLMEVIAGFGLGGSSIALFARVGGGIFTKAADVGADLVDVGADLVGKVEAGIPEDDPRNPAVIADNVGDNVGDVAGMGADLFGSCAESTCAAMVISAVAFSGMVDALLYPILISAIGIPVSLLTLMMVKVTSEEQVGPALKKMLIISSALMAVVMLFVTKAIIPDTFEIGGVPYTDLGVYFCFLAGLIAGLVVGLMTEYYTSHDYGPVREVAKSCETGSATNIIFGLALGYQSAVGPYLAIGLAIYIPWMLAGMYGVAIASLGMLGTLVIALTIDAYGPVSDNAGGIAEMAGMPEHVRQRTDVLDAAGNTTAAIGKGFAIGAAILTSLALFAAFLTRADLLLKEQHGQEYDLLGSINLLDPLVFTALFIGAVLPSYFSAMTMKSVGSAAYEMIEEVRRQFRTIPGLMEGKAEADYEQCVAISTKAALKEMIAPGILIMGTPLITGFLFGIQAVAGVLAGSLVAGGVIAISSSNSGGAWDNAKKYIEKGNLGGKGTETHKAAVVGDTVGDPLKDTSGPSLNILIKLSAILSLVFVPFFVQYGGLLMK
jgi:K(+)-stimulated pyrophosphate-energized sodium pump